MIFQSGGLAAAEASDMRYKVSPGESMPIDAARPAPNVLGNAAEGFRVMAIALGLFLAYQGFKSMGGR